MQAQERNAGVIFTNANCIGCNKCISGCPIAGANVVVKEPDSDRCTVLVDPVKCILCGTCIDACVHRARTYRDDTDAFFDALARGERISLLVAPTLMTDYEKQYHNILGYLKDCGVSHIYNTGIGADIMVWVYMNFILDFGLEGAISQFCPVIVNYLEKFRPELLKFLVPVQSPVLCTAIYVSDYLNNTDALAYISPCIAGKYEISDVNTYGKVTYNVTFERLMRRIEAIDLSQYNAKDELPYGLGSLISTSGGLSENIKQYIGFNEVLIQTSGPTNIFPYFEHYYYQEVNESRELPFLVDAMSCTDGCNFGTGTNCGYGMRNEMSFSAHRSKERAFQSGFVYHASNHQERLEKLNQRFKNLELTSFVRQYDNTRRLGRVVLNKEQIDAIYLSMYKVTEEQRHTDCGACGYKTCHDMAYAIGSNFNYKDNCINYAKDCIRRETEKTNLLLEEISSINEELLKSTQLKSNFLANMSHEIRTPMNAIIGMAEMALRGELPSEERSYLQQIKSSGRSLLAIINDILDFSKIESGKMELSETEYAVMSILNDTVNIVMTRIGEKNITLMVDADPNIPFKLRGDDIRIKQILVNLANNAVKFTQTGFVRISLRHERCAHGLCLTLDIQDSGIGIKPEDQAKLFTSFQQVDSKRNRNIEGTGLGLAIARELVTLMQGEICVKSIYGEGSTFSFAVPQDIILDLPSVRVREKDSFQIASLIENPYVKQGFETAVAQLAVKSTSCKSSTELVEAVSEGVNFMFIEYCFWGDELDAFAKAHPDIQLVVIVDPRKEVVSASYVRKLNQPVYCLNLAAALNRESDGIFDNENPQEESRFEAPDATILIVDDNAINLTVAKGLLSPLHMNIEVASGAREAIALLENTHFDVVFMDHMMPDIDGVEATHMIRAKGGTYYETLPIIALTANAINNAKEMFLREGMSDFVAKPIDVLDIMTKLRRWLPPQKIRNIGLEKRNTKAKPITLPIIERIDVQAGIALSGSLDLYLTILADYQETIEKKAMLIETLEANGDLAGYTIQVHSLKSASKLIGATALSEQAAHLEHCGHKGDIHTIHAETADLLQVYRSYLPILEPYARKKSIEEKHALSSDQLLEHLEALYTALDDFDLDTAKDLTEQLESAVLDEAFQALCERLSDAVSDMEYDDAAAVAEEWKALITTTT